jgi:hypothetical protein
VIVHRDRVRELVLRPSIQDVRRQWKPLLGFRKLPFASSYVPAPNLNTLGSIYAFIFLAGVYAVAWLERFALSTTRGTVVLFVIGVGVLGFIRAVDVWRWRNRGAIELDELPDPATLRLGLAE